MQDQINEMNRKVDAIHEALIGTEYGQDGLVDRVGRLEKYKIKDQKQKWVAVGVFAAITALFKFFDPTKLFH